MVEELGINVKEEERDSKEEIGGSRGGATLPWSST
jgi:hypothetical protein